jgi:O-antigen ligase
MNLKVAGKYIDPFVLFCFCVFILFLPIAHTETVRAFSFGIPLGIWLIKMVVQRRWLVIRTSLDLPLLLFTIVGALSLFTAVDFKYSLEEYFGEWLTGVCLFYLVANNFREGQMKYLLWALLLGNLLMVSYGIGGFFRGGGSLLDYRIRAGSLHSGFGTFSTYLITVLPYLFLGIFFLRRTGYRLFLFALLFFNLLAIYITHTRGAWVAAIFSLLLMGWKFADKKILFSAVLSAVFIFLFFIPDSVLKHYPLAVPNAQVANIETVQARWELTLFILERVKENPFQMLGFGQGSFAKKYPEFASKYEGAQLWHGHNIFLNIVLQTGIQGLVIFCFLIYRLGKLTYTGYRLAASSPSQYYLLATFVMILTFFTRTLFDDFFIDDSALLFWFLVGLGIATAQGEKTLGPPESVVSRIG